MKTEITNNSEQRLCFRTADGLKTVEIGQTRAVVGLDLSDESRARLEADGWRFKDARPVAKRGKAAKAAGATDSSD